MRPTFAGKTGRRFTKFLVAALWSVNLCLLGLAGITYTSLKPSLSLFQPLPTLAVLNHHSPAQAADAGNDNDPEPSANASQQPTVIETLGAPLQEPVVTPTPSPIPFSEGPFTIGFSAGGRPLEIWRFGTGPTRRLIVAGIHGGNEINTIYLADELIGYLEMHPEIVPPNITLYILRSLNPDGEARGKGPAGRPNDHGVDLNRNWPYNWKANWRRDGCFIAVPVSGGTHPASEPETQALMSFIQSHLIDALISYHSAALGIFPGGVPSYPPSVRLAEAIAAVTRYPYPALDTGCEYTGNLTDWAADQGIAAVDIELTNHTNTDFEQNLIVLHVFLNWKR